MSFWDKYDKYLDPLVGALDFIMRATIGLVTIWVFFAQTNPSLLVMVVLFLAYLAYIFRPLMRTARHVSEMRSVEELAFKGRR